MLQQEPFYFSSAQCAGKMFSPENPAAAAPSGAYKVIAYFSGTSKAATLATQKTHGRLNMQSVSDSNPSDALSQVLRIFKLERYLHSFRDMLDIVKALFVVRGGGLI